MCLMFNVCIVIPRFWPVSWEKVEVFLGAHSLVHQRQRRIGHSNSAHHRPLFARHLPLDHGDLIAETWSCATWVETITATKNRNLCFITPKETKHQWNHQWRIRSLPKVAHQWWRITHQLLWCTLKTDGFPPKMRTQRNSKDSHAMTRESHCLLRSQATNSHVPCISPFRLLGCTMFYTFVGFLFPLWEEQTIKVSSKPSN